MKRLEFDYEPSEAFPVWRDGIYSAILQRAELKTSKAGNAMLEVCFEVRDGRKTLRLFDRVVRPGGIWRLGQLAGALGLTREFSEKRFEPKNHLGKSLRVAIITRDDPSYGKRNHIAEFLPSMPGDDEVPF
jgi:hypothetical protein